MSLLSRWKSFDFGPETSVDEKPAATKKKNRSSKISNEDKPESSIKNRNLDFYSKIIPQTVGDLAVHPKKIEEIQKWLNLALNSTKEKRHTQFLLLTGPTGSGKSATIQTLCKTMNVNITEYFNSVDNDYEIHRSSGQISGFLDFFSDSKYTSLFDNEERQKILLVKEFPNVVIKKNDEFFNILEECYYKATYPVVFICSDTNSNDINLERLLFPEEIQVKYNIVNISFNACAATLLKKAIKRAQEVLEMNTDLYKIPSNNVIEAIITTSMGDIRSAMNQFYMASLRDTTNLQIDVTKGNKQGLKRKREDKKYTIKSMMKNESLGLFHGLGRVLNPKRHKEGSSWRINCDIQKIIDEFIVQPLRFNSFLCENYLKYFGHIEDLNEAADVLSLSSTLMQNWDNLELLSVALWIEVLGLMIANRHKESKWTQITAPKKIEKIQFRGEKVIQPMERYYYNIITKTNKYHVFNYNDV